MERRVRKNAPTSGLEIQMTQPQIAPPIMCDLKKQLANHEPLKFTVDCHVCQSRHEIFATTLKEGISLIEIGKKKLLNRRMGKPDEDDPRLKEKDWK